MDLYTITGGIISSLILGFGHYFPWHRFCGKLLEEPFSRLWAYCYGSGACWVGFSYWRYFGEGDLITPLGLMGFYIVGGLVVGATYRIDTIGQKRSRRRRQSDKLDEVAQRGHSPADEIPTVKERYKIR